MKKVSVLLLGFLLTALLLGCDGEHAKEQTYEIVVVPTAWSDELDEEIREYVKDRPELNVYQNMSQEPDGKYQALLVEDLIAQQVDAICLQPVDKTVEPMVQKAEQAGIVVVTGDDIPAMIDQAEKLLKQ